MDFELVSEFEPTGDQPKAISEIVNGVEENIKVTGCGNHPLKYCTGKSEKCITHHFLEDLESLIENYLDSVALSDIALSKENSFLGLEQ